MFEINTKISKEEDVNISDEEYAIIETVYAWHPSISNEFGKDEIANLYCFYGWALIMDMLPRAKKMMELENQLSVIRGEEHAVTHEMELLRNGDSQMGFLQG